MNRRKKIAIFLVLLMVLFSAVEVPVANATIIQGYVANLAFRSVAPSVITTLGSGSALIIGSTAIIGGGLIYIAIKSGGVTALKNWWNSNIAPSWKSDGTDNFYNRSTDHFHIVGSGTSWTLHQGSGTYGNSDWAGYYCTHQTQITSGFTSYAQAWNMVMSGQPTPSNPAPAVPTDYSAQLANSQPAFPAGTVYGTPGAAAALTNSSPATSVQIVTDAVADTLIKSLPMTEINSDSSQAPPVAGPVTDNAVTKGDAEQVGLLQSMLNYLMHLFGIKTAVESVATNTNTISNKLDNVTTTLPGMKSSIDCSTSQLIAAREAVESSNRFLDNIAHQLANPASSGADNIIQTITQPVTQTSVLSNRMTQLKTLAATKFPFSIVSSYTEPSSVNITSPDIGMPDIILPNGDHVTTSFPISLDPAFQMFRNLLSWLFIAGTAAMIIRRGLSI